MMATWKKPAHDISVCFLALLFTVGAVTIAHGQVAQKSYVDDPRIKSTGN